MAISMPPPSPIRVSHPDKPVMDDDEDYVEYICRTADHWSESPPEAPEGFELMPCMAEPRHFPVYMPVDDDLYPSNCPTCEYLSLRDDRNALHCKANHRRWKSWKVWRRLSSRLYVLGITSSGGGTSYFGCETCNVKRQEHPPRWSGRRVYILGVRRETWACLRRGHLRREHISCGLCSVCCPCPECGSTDPTHYSCELGGRY